MATTPRGGRKVSRQRGTGCAAGRARRPRRAARRGTCIPRARGRPCRAHGDVPGTRAAEDVGPYHKRPVAAMRPCRPGGGRDASAGRARRPRRAARRGRARCAHGDVHAACTGTFMPRAWGRPGGRGPPGTSAPTTNVPVTAMRPCRPGGGTGCAAGRARRPRRAARRGTRTLRARGRPCRAHGDVPGTRAAEDVGPYHKCPRGRHAPVPPRRGAGMRRLVGRDVLGAPRAGGRARCAHGDVHAARTGTFRGRGPPRTSAPTTNVPVAAMRPCRPDGGPGCAGW